MNFICEMEGKEIQVELKYCERCGGLWLRAQGIDGVYCASCRMRLAAMPDPAKAPPLNSRRRKPRMKKADLQREDVQNPAQIDSLQGVAAAEVWA
jgi:Zn-finger nucleic acid-binding protein